MPTASGSILHTPSVIGIEWPTLLTIRGFCHKKMRMAGRAKRYVRRHDRSLSDLVSSYLRQITADEQDADDVDPQVRDVADEIPMDPIVDLHDARYQHLKDKYLRA